MTDVADGTDFSLLEGLGSGARTEAVYSRLRDAILLLELEPGQQISQLELTRRIGVSRTPLREALRMLERERLIEPSAPHSLVTISRLSMDDLETLYALRTAGEALAAWLTVPQLTKHVCDELARDLKAIDNATDLDARVAHRRFHAALRAGAGQRMEQELAQLFEQAERYQLAFWRRSQKSDKSRKRAEHREILKACRVGDRALVVRLLVEHTSRTAYGLVEAEDPGRALPRLDAAVRMTKRGLR